MPTTEVKVAAGVIERDGQVLVTQRAAKAHQGGLWEFPGGKLESRESAEQALVRELAEELNIQVTQQSPLIEIAHDYGDKQVRLFVFVVHDFEGEPQGLEGQPMQWIASADLNGLSFPAANLPIIQAYLDQL
jgi:8-oxo-dGTP diphosphatase